uniref:Sulfatase-modifying factor enzyme-like domain-containing protein n=1 Tax=Cricetulus griseus TaxID=10029 RepID=A0A8C2QKY7_CRIGR
MRLSSMGSSLPVLSLMCLLSSPRLQLGNAQAPTMVQLPGGRFLMGTDAPDGRDGEGPAREVTVKSFTIDVFPVTNKDFRYCKGFVFLFFCFCESILSWHSLWRSGDQAGLEVTEICLPLPHECGRINSPQPPRSIWWVGESPLLPLLMTHYYTIGLYDLMGNVWEWTASIYQSASQDMRVLRGASWIDTADGSANHRARVTTRMGNTPDSASDNLGFRCASSTGQLKEDL